MNPRLDGLSEKEKWHDDDRHENAAEKHPAQSVSRRCTELCINPMMSILAYRYRHGIKQGKGRTLESLTDCSPKSRWCQG